MASQFVHDCSFPNMVIGPSHKWDDPPPTNKPELAGKMQKIPACKWRRLTKTDGHSLDREARRGNNNTFARTGEISGVFVVDIDNKDDGLKAWEELLTRNRDGADFCNHVVSTPSGGYHYYFLYEERLRRVPNASKFHLYNKPVGIDVRTNGGIIVLPGSIAQSGSYKKEKWSGEPKTVPEWLLEFLLQKRPGDTLPIEKREKRQKPAVAAVADTKEGFVDKQLSSRLNDICCRLMSITDPTMINVYENWLHVGFALKNTLGEAGWPLFNAKSKENVGKYVSEDSCRAMWDAVQPIDTPKYGIEWLYDLVRENTNEETYEAVMHGVNDRYKKDVEFDRQSLQLLHLLKKCTTPAQEQNIKACIKQLMTDTIVIIGTSQVLLRECSWEDGSITFKGVSQPKFFDSMRLRKVEYGDSRYSLYAAIEDIMPEITYTKACFYPHGMDGNGLDKVNIGNHKAFNLFMGFKIWPTLIGKTEIKNQENVDILLHHIHKILMFNEGDQAKQQECGNWFELFLAYKLFQPYDKLEKVPVFTSAEGGVGKSVLILWFIDKLLGNLYGEEVTSEHQLDPKFNARARFLILALFDDMKHKLDLKAQATKRRLKVEHKGVDAEDCPDFKDMVVNSNVFECVADEKGGRRYVHSECCIDYAVGKPDGPAYIDKLLQALDDPVTAEDFAFHLRSVWQAHKWDKKYSPKTVAMAKKEAAFTDSPVITTLRTYGEMYAHEQLSANGIPRSCLFAFHKILHGKVKCGQKDEDEFDAEVQRILQNGKLHPNEYAVTRLRHKPTPWTHRVTEYDKYNQTTIVSDLPVCSCTGSAQLRGYKNLTLNGLCQALRTWQNNSEHLPHCNCLTKTITQQSTTIAQCVVDRLVAMGPCCMLLKEDY